MRAIGPGRSLSQCLRCAEMVQLVHVGVAKPTGIEIFAAIAIVENPAPSAPSHRRIGCDTSLDNLVMLCRHHHHLVHEGGFVCEKLAEGNVHFRDRRKKPLELSPQMPGLAANDDVQQWMDRAFFEADIDSESCTAKWRAGERMDWQAAVGSLFYQPLAQGRW